MTNKRNCLGILLILAVFCVGVLGCSTTPNAYYYNLGDVSEENCALIDVSLPSRVVNPAYLEGKSNTAFLESDYSYSNLVKIDGQGNANQWPKPPEGLFGFTTRAIVRVTPGVHTFTITLFIGSDYEAPLDITYDCKAGKGYSLEFLAIDPDARQLAAAGFFTMDESGNRGSASLGRVSTTIVISESPLNEQGSVSWLSGKEVARKTEGFIFDTYIQPNDMDRLVKRKN